MPRKKPVVKLNKKVYGEAVDKAFEANKKAREKTPAKKTPAKMPAVKRPNVKPAPLPKPKPKPKVVQMPSKINPFKMTPAQKAQYLKNPERYDG